MKYFFVAVLTFSVTSFAKSFAQNDLEQVIQTVNKKAYHPMSDDEIYKAAISGILAAMEKKARPSQASLKIVEPPANTLLEPRNSKELKNEMKGEVSGIGVAISFDKKKGHQYPIIKKVIDKSGAKKVGLKDGDQILKVDGVPTNKFKTFMELVYAIRGPVDSFVKIDYLRDGNISSKKVQRVKLSFDPFSVVTDYKKALLVEMGSFNEKSVANLSNIIKRAKSEKKPLILDLSGSTGGLFSEGLNAIRLFAKKGDKILVTQNRDGKKTIETAKEDGMGVGLRVVLFTSPKTKSISEAFAGALRKLTGAVIIGQTTYGKATVESLVGLKKGYQVKFTIGEMNLPGEKTWNTVGILPDIPVAEGVVVEGVNSHLRVAEKILNI